MAADNLTYGIPEFTRLMEWGLVVGSCTLEYVRAFKCQRPGKARSRRPRDGHVHGFTFVCIIYCVCRRVVVGAGRMAMSYSAPPLSVTWRADCGTTSTTSTHSTPTSSRRTESTRIRFHVHGKEREEILRVCSLPAEDQG